MITAENEIEDTLNKSTLALHAGLPGTKSSCGVEIWLYTKNKKITFLGTMEKQKAEKKIVRKWINRFISFFYPYSVKSQLRVGKFVAL